MNINGREVDITQFLHKDFDKLKDSFKNRHRVVCRRNWINNKEVVILWLKE